MKERFLRRNCGVFLCLSVILWMLPSFVFATTLTDTNEGIDAVLLIDTSGSMRFSDSKRTALESAKLFIDMMETSNSRIGVIAFTDTLQGVIPLTSINTPGEKERIKNLISQYSYYGYTDIGLSLSEAVNMLAADMSNTNSPMILLMTDGEIELSPNQTERTVEMSYNDVENALSVLQDRAPVYTLGLNHGDSVDIDFLRMVSGRTSAHTYIAEEASSLPQIFNEIFAAHIRSSLTEVATFITDGETFTDVVVEIDSVFVAEANIVLLSKQRLTDVRLLDPAGKEITFDDDAYSISKSDQYSMIKLVSPVEGDWILRVKGLPRDRVKINLINNYNVDIAISVTQSQMSDELFNPENPVTVTAGFVSANTNYNDLDLYHNAKAELQVYDQHMTLTAAVPMQNTGTAFTLDYQPQNADDVRLAVQVINNNFQKSSVVYPLSFNQDATAEPTEETSIIVPEPETAAAEPTPTMTPTTPVSEEPPVQPEKPASPAFNIGLAVLAVIIVTTAAIGIALIVRGNRSKSRMFTGYLEVRAMTEDGFYTSLEAPDLSTYTGRTPLADFLTTSLSDNGLEILAVSVDTAHIVMIPGEHKGSPAIILENKSRCEISDDENNILIQKRIIWLDGRRLSFVNADAEDLSKLEITYRSNTDA